MKFSFNWISELVEGLDLAPRDLERLITMKTAECEGIEDIAPLLASASAARIVAVEEIAGALGLRVTEGKKVFEVRPPARVDKGTAVLILAARLHALDDDASIVFIGDDRTDEDAFRALRLRQRNAVTVRVAPDERTGTAAEFAVADPEEVLFFLQWLRHERGMGARSAARGKAG